MPSLSLKDSERQYLLDDLRSPHSPSEGKTHRRPFSNLPASSSSSATTSSEAGGTTSGLELSSYQSLSSTSVPLSQPLEEKKLSWEQYGRRTLYGSLPFMAAFGMSKTETEMKKVLSAVSINALLEQQESVESVKVRFRAFFSCSYVYMTILLFSSLLD